MTDCCTELGAAVLESQPLHIGTVKQLFSCERHSNQANSFSDVDNVIVGNATDEVCTSGSTRFLLKQGGSSHWIILRVRCLFLATLLSVTMQL